MDSLSTLISNCIDYDFNKIILIIFILGFIFAIKNYLKINFSINKLKDLTHRNNENILGLSRQAKESKTNTNANDKLLENYKTNGDELIRKRIDLLENNKHNGSNIDLSSLSETFWTNLNSDFLFISLPKFISKGLILLGLLGTVGGLVISLSALEPVLNYMKEPNFTITEFQIKFTQHFSSALGGMDIAFTSSLVGIVLSIILTLLIIYNDGYLAKYCSSFDEFTQAKLIPLIMTKDEDQTKILIQKIDEMKKSFKNSAATLNETSNAFGTHIYNFGLYSQEINKGNKNLQKLLDDYYNNVINDIQARVSSLDTIQEKITNTLSNFEQISSMLKNIQETTSKTVEKAADSISDVNINLTKTCQKFDQLNNDFRKDQQNLLINLDNIANTLDSRFNHYDDISKQTITNLEALNISINTNKDSLSEYLTSLSNSHKENLTNYYNELLQNHSDKLDSQLKELYSQAMNELIAQLKTTDSTIQNLFDTYKTILDDINSIKDGFNSEEISNLILNTLNQKNTEIIDNMFNEKNKQHNFEKDKLVADQVKLCDLIEDLKKAKQEEINYHKKLFEYIEKGNGKN